MTEFISTCSMPLAVIFLIVGFFFLVKGADIFVEGSSSIAKRFHVPAIIIGLTIVAMGTSLPETAVSVVAAIQHKNTLAISNVVGSNIFNMMVVIGFCAIMTPVAVQKATLKRDFPYSVFAALLLLVLGGAGKEGGQLQSEEIEAAEAQKVMSMPKSLLFLVVGVAGIVIGGDVVVDSASNIALKIGMSQTLVGLTIVSIGTSLPELVTSVVAARKNEVDMALGNAIGSNIFNILFVLGLAGVISPMPFLMENIIDIMILIVLSLLIWGFAWTKEKISRKEGIVMLVLYVVYVIYICMR